MTELPMVAGLAILAGIVAAILVAGRASSRSARPPGHGRDRFGAEAGDNGYSGHVYDDGGTGYGHSGHDNSGHWGFGDGGSGNGGFGDGGGGDGGGGGGGD
ncbi:hypothetical protein [Cellulomonas rhizosphaerae]|uniref:Uncharacterized protein n=1 Tax=Cellulomonas rhizosphaerae TaxID=2293719 RepID=A0A413RKB1_9CELL|nr:hypothetical protein [Cellulomonas rhizosphaerae]RHA39528.1 hypothetical protein D1825_11795 [Cellulomonas rhizosphaerae]